MKKLLLILALTGVAFAQEPTGKRIAKLAAPVDGCVALGGGYFDCEERAVLPEGAVVVSHGADRYTNLPSEDKAAVLRARTFRMKDGTSLRARINTEFGINIPVRQALLKWQSLTTEQRNNILARLRQYVNSGLIDERAVTMAATLTGDVVEDDGIVPHVFLGEAAP